MRRALAVVAVVVAGALLVARGPGARRPPAHETITDAGRAASAMPAPTAPSAAAPATPAAAVARALPRSLRGTTPDGELVADESGHLAVTRETRRFFDYFLAASGEWSDARIRKRLDDEIRTRLAPGSAAEARALLDRYLTYRARARALPPAADPAAAAATLASLRRDTLGPEAARAFFGDEETLTTAALERRRIAADPDLPPDERARRLAAVEDTLPVEMRAARAQAIAPLQLMQEEARLRDAGASPAELRALRERTVGVEAADRLEALDRARAEWQARLADYRRARDAIVADPGRSATDKAAAIDALRAARFTGPERSRVAALDGDGSPAR